MLCVDGVAFAPHRLVDVKALDVDFYVCFPPLSSCERRQADSYRHSRGTKSVEVPLNFDISPPLVILATFSDPY